MEKENVYQINEWRTEMGRLHKQMEDIVKGASAEKRNLNEEENEKWGKMEVDFKNLQEQVRKATFLQESVVPDPAKVVEARKEEDPKLREKRTWTQFIRQGKEALNAEDRSFIESRGTSTQITTTDSLGGYLVPEFWNNEIIIEMAHYSGMLEASQILRTATGGKFNFPGTDETAIKGARIGQGTGDDVADNTITNKELDSYTYTSKMIKVAVELMQDSAFPIDPYVQRLVADRIGRIINTEMTTGTGSSQPNGVVTASSTGKNAASTSAITRNELVDLQHSVDRAYRGPNCRWMMHDSTLAAIKKLTVGSSDDRPLWQPDLINGTPGRLEGFEIVVNNDIDELTGGASSDVALFGDFSKYIIRLVGQMELARSMERYFDERVIGFYGYLRADGELIDTAAIKKLTLASS